MKNGKRILKVKVRHITDESPDLSHFGDYSDEPKTKYSIDRAHSLDCIVNAGVPEHTLFKCGGCGAYHRWEFDGDCRDDGQGFGGPEDYRTRNELAEDAPVHIKTAEEREEGCTCGIHGDLSRGEFRYFNGLVQNYKGLPDAEIRKYVRQDYERVERNSAGDWYMIGIRAEAEIGLPCGVPGSLLIQKITSGGLWGIESDSDESYFNEVMRDELRGLRQQLEQLGFSKRAISNAFGKVDVEGR